MKIGIDARFWGLEHAGIGRYVIELIKALMRIDKKNKYLIFLRKKYFDLLDFPSNFQKTLAEIKHYTFEEQWFLAEIFAKENLDLLHVPHFNAPLFYNKPFVVTIHDLLWHEIKGLTMTTQNPLVYYFKYFGYRIVAKHSLNNSKFIMVPSETIRKKLIDKHKVSNDKITVTYEASSIELSKIDKNKIFLKKFGLMKPYIVYIGSAYPHKNIDRVVAAMKLVNKDKHILDFVIISARSVFLEKLMKKVKDLTAEKYINILGFVNDEHLNSVIYHAKALIQPSLSEGFGLTGIEAMSIGTPVIASRLDTFSELYNDSAIYFNPTSVEDIASKITTIIKNQKLANKLRKKGKLQTKKYSWDELAKQTLEVYQKAFNNN